VSIETVSPLQDSWPAEPTRSLAIEFMRQATPGFISSEIWPHNSRKFIQVDKSRRSVAAYRTACTRSQTFLGSRPRLADLEQMIVDKSGGNDFGPVSRLIKDSIMTHDICVTCDAGHCLNRHNV